MRVIVRSLLDRLSEMKESIILCLSMAVALIALNKIYCVHSMVKARNLEKGAILDF